MWLEKINLIMVSIVWYVCELGTRVREELHDAGHSQQERLQR